MNWFSHLFKKSSPKNVLQYEDVFGLPYSGGYSVNTSTAISQNAVWACINLLSSSIASLPITLYYVDDDGKKERDVNNSLYDVLKYQPNNFQTPADFISTMMYGLLIHGESFARIYKNSRNEITSLIPLENGGVTVQLNKNNTDLEYIVYYADGTGKQQSETLSSSQVLHIRGLFSSILKPMSPISHSRETLAINGTLHAHQLAFFSSGAAKPGGIISSPGKVAPTTIKRILQIFNKTSSGIQNSGKTLFLEEGLTFTPTQLNNVDSQFIEAMKFSIPEICRIFGVPPALIGDNEKVTYSSAEQQSLAFVQYSLRPYIEKFEQAMMKSLVNSLRRPYTEIDFDTTALLRGDATSQSNYVSKLIQNCTMTPNEARQFLGLSISEDPKADELYIQTNMSPLQSLNQAQQVSNPAPTSSEEADSSGDDVNEAVAMANAIFLAKNIVDIGSNFDKMIDSKKIGKN
jgi:HK97 family phage portal protein